MSLESFKSKPQAGYVPRIDPQSTTRACRGLYSEWSLYKGLTWHQDSCSPVNCSCISVIYLEVN